MLNAPDDDDARFTAGPGRGAPPRNVKLGDDEFLLDHLGGGFDLLWFTDGAPLPAEVRGVVEAMRARGVRVAVTAIGSGGPVVGAEKSLGDAQGRCRSRYGVTAPGALYLLRPDQHVCGRWLAPDARRLQAALEAALPARGGVEEAR